jgi:hypothetical protein
MKKNQVEAQLLASGQLRVLLTLSRDLLQTDEASGSLELVGQTLVEMIRPDSALLILRGDRFNIVGFDKHGTPIQPVRIIRCIKPACPCCLVRDARTNRFAATSSANTAGRARLPWRSWRRLRLPSWPLNGTMT